MGPRGYEGVWPRRELLAYMDTGVAPCHKNYIFPFCLWLIWTARPMRDAPPAMRRWVLKLCWCPCVTGAADNNVERVYAKTFQLPVFQ